MNMWRILLILMAAFGLAALAGLVALFHRFTPFQRLGERHRLLSWLAAALPVAAIGLLFCAINVTTMIVVLLHLLVAWALCDGVGWLIQRFGRRRVSRDVTGLVAIGLTVIYLGIGWFMAHHVFETRYQLTTSKPLSKPLRIAMLADAHLGTTLSGDDFARQMLHVQQARPDAVVLVGDFVDDDSTREDMRAACAALGRLDTPCGVFFTYGNHDEGYYHHRNFTGDELRTTLAENGVTLLADQQAPLGDDAVLIGRKDRYDRKRRTMAMLTGDLDPNRYAIVLDHQPNDYAAEAESPVDLVLSGHTHGGHIFPAGLIGLWMKANDAIYGHKVINGTDFIVTSGISGWAIPFKTGTYSEYVIIDITPI